MKKKRIIHLIPNLLKGGAQRLAIDICNELSKLKNFEVLLIVLSKKNQYKNICENIRIIHISSEINLSILFKNKIDINEYEKIISSFKPHVIHSHLYLAEIVAHENPRLGIKYISHCHDNMSQFGNFKLSKIASKYEITRNYERIRLFSKYKKVNKKFISISEDTSKFFMKVLPKKLSNKIIKIPNAIKRESFIDKNINIKKKPSDQIKLINVGNFLTKKNQIFLIEVVNYLKNKEYSVHLSLIGDGINFSKIQKKIRDYSLEDNVTLFGSVNNVEEYLWENDIYVHSAIYEPFGLVLIEAMTAGLPIICLNGKGNEDIIINNENGFLINSKDPNIFGEKIITLYENKDLYDEIQKNALIFSASFDIEIYVEKLIENY